MSHFFVVRTSEGMLFLNCNAGILTHMDLYGQPHFQTTIDVGQESDFMQCLMEWYGKPCPYAALLACIQGGNQAYWQRQLKIAFNGKQATGLLKPVVDIASRVRQKLSGSSFEIKLEKYSGYALSIREEQRHVA